MLRLDDLPGGEEASGAFAVSADGRIIAGFGSDEAGKQAVLWIDRKPITLAAVMHEAGIEVPFGWTLSQVEAISDDGRVLVGNGFDPNGVAKGFQVALPEAL